MFDFLFQIQADHSALMSLALRLPQTYYDGMPSFALLVLSASAFSHVLANLASCPCTGSRRQTDLRIHSCGSWETHLVYASSA